MVIIFSDTDASIAASVYGIVSSLKDSLKTVILQFTDKFPVEEVLIGKGRSLIKDYGTFDNTGMDALIRYQSFSALTKEHFNMCVTPVFKTANLLDLVAAPLIDGFYGDYVTDSEKISEIITVAEAIYDNLVIVLNNMDSELAETIKKALSTCEYRIIRSMRQGEKVLTHKLADNEYMLIHDYNPDSLFTIKYYRKLFNSSNVSVIPYSISFKDAYLSGDLLMFLRRNLSIDSKNRRGAVKEDCNADFIIRVLDFTDRINFQKNAFDLEETDYENMHWEHKETVRTANDRRVIDGDNVYIKEKGKIDLTMGMGRMVE